MTQPINPDLVVTITQKTAVSFSFAGIATLVWAGWACANFVRDIRDEVRQGVASTRRDIEDLKREYAFRFGQIWTVDDQQEWVWQLQDKNKESRLEVPSVREVKGPETKATK